MRGLIALMLLALPAPALADDVCKEAWLARNILLDRAGACFSTPMGQRYFNNEGCGAVSLSAAQSAQVARFREVEGSYGCSIDTSKAPMTDVPTWLFAFDLLPVNDGLESACIGWTGATHLLRSGPGGRITGELRAGDTIQFRHDGTERFQFLTITRDGHVIARGWHEGALDFEQCEMFAG